MSSGSPNGSDCADGKATIDTAPAAVNFYTEHPNQIGIGMRYLPTILAARPISVAAGAI
jgi:hypothetical protein